MEQGRHSLGISREGWHCSQYELIWLLDLHLPGEDVGLNTISGYGRRNLHAGCGSESRMDTTEAPEDCGSHVLHPLLGRDIPK